MSIRLKLAALAGAIVGIFLAVALSTGASAHVPTVTPGAQCAHEGETGTHNGEQYICVQKHGESCPSWHHVPQPSASTTWTRKPCECGPSASASPTPSRTPTPTPTATASPTPTPSGSASTAASPTASTQPSKQGGAVPSTTPVSDNGQLPVTGSPVVGIAVLGLSGVVGGSLIVVGLRRRRTGNA